ncbi:MAG: threonine/serine exporter family protein, partial [Phycisphaerae bacterium]|nr:threonine/serine exporter family protein [Phycisphaerae bacterium]
GGLGFKSLEALLGRDVLSGMEIAVSVVLIAASLVGGLFLANVAAPTKKLV